MREHKYTHKDIMSAQSFGGGKSRQHFLISRFFIVIVCRLSFLSVADCSAIARVKL